MNEKRNNRLVIIAILGIAVVGLSIAFAALSQQLNITGVGTVKGSTWSIFFDNLAEPNITGNAVIEADATLINNSTTMTFAVSLKQPGDSVSYTFDVKNNGTIDAEINSVSLTGVTAAQDANVTYTITYDDGGEIKVGDQLLSQQSRKLLLTVAYDASATTVSATDIVLDLGATITYVQM